MGRLFITLAIITSTIFASHIPERYNTDNPTQNTDSFLEKKRSGTSGSSGRNSRNDVNNQQYFNGNRWYLMNTNDGRVGNNYETDGVGGKWPRGNSQNMIWSSGLWIGSMDNYGNAQVSGVRWNESDFTPGEIINDEEPISYESLSGVWRLSPVEGAIKVGPAINSSDWWQNSMDDVDTRWCLFDDEYVFHGDGTFENIFHGETWVQPWQSDSVDGEGCFSPVYPHNNSNDAYWDLDNSTITIHGVGAYVGLASISNSGDLAWTDSLSIPDSISYEITYFDGNTMVISCDFSMGYWTYTFQKDNSSNNLSDPYAPESRVLKVNRWDNPETSEDYNDWASYGFTPKDSSGSPHVQLDQSLFSIYNDNSDRKAEVRQVLYGGMDADDNSPLNDAVILRYEIENKSQTTWNDAYVSMFCDFDLGESYENDLVSYDHENSIVYYMNPNEPDGFQENTVLGLAPLSFDHELISLMVNEDPEGDYENYNLQRGLHKDGSEMFDPYTNEPTSYMYSGNISDSTGWIDNEPRDKFMLVTFYVGNVEPGQTINLDLALFVAATGGDNVETLDEGASHVEFLRWAWDSQWPVSMFDRPIIETDSNYGLFGGSMKEFDVPQGDNISNNFQIRNGGNSSLNLDIDMGEDGWESISLNYGETHEIFFSFDAPYLDAPKTIRVPEDTWSIYDALEMTTQSPANHMNYHFMHNDGSTENFDVSGEFYVAHSGDTILVSAGGYYHLDYEISDRSVHLIAQSSDSIESAVFADSSYLSIRGRVPNFTFKGFTVQDNHQGFLEINDYYDQWSPTHVNITDNIFRNNHKDGSGTAIFAVNIHGNISSNIFEDNHAQWMGGAMYLENIYCDISHNVFRNNTSGNWGGGAIRLNRGAAHVYKNTFFDNYAEEGARALAVRSTDHIITSNILWGGEHDLIGTNFEGYHGIEYNLIQGGFWDNGNNLDNDPMMHNPWDGDFTLVDGSPCIDSGHPDDFYNDPDGSRSDMGAFFFDQSSFSMEFNGDSYLRVNNNPSISNFGGELSVSAWVMVTGGEGTHRNIISKAGANPQSFALTVSDVDRFRPHVYSQSEGWYNFDGNIPVEYNTWNHVAFSYSNAEGELSLYVNGQLDSTIYIVGSVNNNDADMYIGSYLEANGSNYHNFVGLIDDLSLWNRSFSEYDIHALMNLGLSGEDEGLLGYWNFDEETFPMVNDLSPYGNHGENINGAAYSTNTPPVMNATLGEFDFLVNGSSSSVVMSYRDHLDLTFVHENVSDTIYFQVYRDINFNGQLDEQDINHFKSPDFRWLAGNNHGIISVADQQGIASGELYINDDNPGIGITTLPISMEHGIDPWAWIWRYTQNSTSFIHAWDHNGNDRTISIHVTGTNSEAYIEGRTLHGEYGNMIIEVFPHDHMDSGYEFSYLAATGPDGHYRVDLFDTLDFAVDYNFHINDVYRVNSNVSIDYQEHQNNGMNWFDGGITVNNGTYGIDVFFKEYQNAIYGNVFVNGEVSNGGYLDLFNNSDYYYGYDDYYYYYEDSTFFENYTYINDEGHYVIWYDEPRNLRYWVCGFYQGDDYGGDRCKEQTIFLPGGFNNLDIHLIDDEPQYQITGTVRDTMGNTIYGAEVIAYAHNEFGTQDKTFSDWDGNFALVLYGDVNYDLEAGGEGWVGEMRYVDAYEIEMGDHFEFYLEPSESGENVIYNGGFEEGFNGWEVWPYDENFSMIIGTGYTMYNSDQSFEAFSGDSSLKLWGMYSDDYMLPEGSVHQTFYDHFGPGQQLEGSAWLMAHEDDYFGDGPSNFVMFAKYFDDSWNWKGMHISQPFDREYPPNDWHNFQLNAIIPDDVHTVQIGVMFTQPDLDQNGGVYVDEMHLEENNGDYYTAYLEGHVFDEETGEPIEEAMVHAISDDQSFTSWGFTTNEDGFFHIPVRGERGYFISATRSPQTVYSESFEGDFSYHYVHTDDTGYLDLYIGTSSSNEDPIVEGWLRDWYTGEYLSDATILFAYDQDGEIQTIEQTTDVDGYFMTQVPADRDYDLFIYKDGYWAEHDAFYLHYGDHYVLEIGIAPLNMAARVYGSVTDANNGDIIRGAEAVLHCGDSEDWDHTGALGTYRVFSYYPENCGDGMLSVWADGYQTQDFSVADLDLQAGQSVTVNIQLEEGNDPDPAVMLGRVHSSNSGDGIPFAQVSAYSHNTGDSYAAEADDSGFYFLELVGEQEYSIQVTAEGYNDVHEDFYIHAYDSVYHDFYLDDAPQSRFFGYVTNADGDSLSDVRVYFQDQNGNWSNTSTDGFGHYSKHVYPGSYQIIFANNDYYVFSYDSVHIHQDEEMHLDVSLEQIYEFDGGVAGVIYGESGSTLSDVYINAFNYNYDATTYSNEDGAFYLELVNGTYDIEFWKEGYEYVYIPGAFTVENNVVTYDMSLVQPGVPQPPVIVHLEDVPNDQGRQLDMAWSPGDPQDLGAYPFYSVWRERNEDLPPGAPQLWHFISMVPYHDFDLYNMIVPTLGDSTDEGVFMSTFMVTAHTDDPTVFFDSSPVSAYSIDNIFPAVPDSFYAVTTTGEVSLSWSEPSDEDFAYHNIYRNNLMDENPAVIFTTTNSFYVDSDVDASSNYEYWVTAVDHNGNESDASSIVEISGSMLSTDADLLPDAFALNQNYPNPFNPSTQIRYALPEQSQVVLTVYDMLGRKVRTLVNGVQDAGYRTVMWNATSDLGTPVSAGMYIYTIRANEFYEVKKMILLK